MATTGLASEVKGLTLEDLGWKHVGTDLPKNFEGHTLFLPAVSVGNVGQLTLDLLLSNLPEQVKKIGRFFHPALEPVVGSDIHLPEGAPPQLMTSCEAYWAEKSKYVLIHFHAPVAMRGRNEFVKSLVKWIQEKQFLQVVCFSSIFSADRVDAQLEGEPFRFLCANSDELGKRLKELEWKELERRQFPAPAVFDGGMVSKESDAILHLPGSGITQLLHDECQTNGVPFLALIVFASEGDNTPEALTLFEMTDRVFGFRKINVFGPSSLNANSDVSPSIREKLIIPLSWTHFDPNSHASMY